MALKTAGRALGLAAGVAAFAASGAAIELDLPASQYYGATAPRILNDPDRPADAPTATAIEAVTTEDGAQAGLSLAAKTLQASHIAYGPRDGRSVIPLINQATAKQRAGLTAAALIDYRAAIELAESTGGPREDLLFDAWYGAGHAHLLAGQIDAAALALQTALQLHRVNRGLYSAEQLEVLHALASALRERGRGKEADELQMRRIEVAERVHGLGTPELGRAYIPVGRWFREEGQYDAAISLHGLALEYLQKKDRNDPVLIGPLLELALSGGLRRRQDNGAPLPGQLQPAVALARAENIAETRKGSDPVDLAHTLIGIGDVQLALSRRQQANKLYARAARLLAEAHQPPPFSEPAFVIFRPPPVPQIEGADGYVLAEFTVEATGRVKNARVLEFQPPSLDQDIASGLRQSLSEARMRPRIENGAPVASKGVRFRLPVRGGSA